MKSKRYKYERNVSSVPFSSSSNSHPKTKASIFKHSSQHSYQQQHLSSHPRPKWFPLHSPPSPFWHHSQLPIPGA